MRWWDLLIFLALIFTALVTPYDVAFLDNRLDAFFFVNRTVDSVFFTDMMFQFFLWYQEGSDSGGPSADPRPPRDDCKASYADVERCMREQQGQVNLCQDEWEAFRRCHDGAKKTPQTLA